MRNLTSSLSLSLQIFDSVPSLNHNATVSEVIDHLVSNGIDPDMNQLIRLVERRSREGDGANAPRPPPPPLVQSDGGVLLKGLVPTAVGRAIHAAYAIAFAAGKDYAAGRKAAEVQRIIRNPYVVETDQGFSAALNERFSLFCQGSLRCSRGPGSRTAEALPRRFRRSVREQGAAGEDEASHVRPSYHEGEQEEGQGREGEGKEVEEDEDVQEQEVNYIAINIGI